MNAKYGFIPSSHVPQKNSCVSTTGSAFTLLYLILQLAFLLVIGVSVSHQTIVLFSMAGWGLVTIHAAFNLILALIMLCAYHFEFSTWLSFKPLLTLAAAGEVATHVGVPVTFWILRAVSVEEHNKAIYETLMLIFGVIAVVDGLVLLAMTGPYYCLYQEQAVYFQPTADHRREVRGKVYEMNSYY